MQAIAEEFAQKGLPPPQTPAESVAYLLKVVDSLNPSDKGLLLNHKERALQA